jgi:hypothetical protein
MMVLLQIIQMLQEQSQGNMLFVWIRIDVELTLNHAVVTQNRNVPSIHPRNETNYTSRKEKGKENFFHVSVSCVFDPGRQGSTCTSVRQETATAATIIYLGIAVEGWQLTTRGWNSQRSDEDAEI